jgi:hypothetical protein
MSEKIIPYIAMTHGGIPLAGCSITTREQRLETSNRCSFNIPERVMLVTFTTQGRYAYPSYAMIIYNYYMEYGPEFLCEFIEILERYREPEDIYFKVEDENIIEYIDNPNSNFKYGEQLKTVFKHFGNISAKLLRKMDLQDIRLFKTGDQKINLNLSYEPNETFTYTFNSSNPIMYINEIDTINGALHKYDESTGRFYDYNINTDGRVTITHENRNITIREYDYHALNRTMTEIEYTQGQIPNPSNPTTSIRTFNQRLSIPCGVHQLDSFYTNTKTMFSGCKVNREGPPTLNIPVLSQMVLNTTLKEFLERISLNTPLGSTALVFLNACHVYSGIKVPSKFEKILIAPQFQGVKRQYMKSLGTKIVSLRDRNLMQEEVEKPASASGTSRRSRAPYTTINLRLQKQRELLERREIERERAEKRAKNLAILQEAARQAEARLNSESARGKLPMTADQYQAWQRQKRLLGQMDYDKWQKQQGARKLREAAASVYDLPPYIQSDSQEQQNRQQQQLKQKKKNEDERLENLREKRRRNLLTSIQDAELRAIQLNRYLERSQLVRQRPLQLQLQAQSQKKPQHLSKKPRYELRSPKKSVKKSVKNIRKKLNHDHFLNF